MSFVCLLDILPRPGAAELRVALILVCRRVASALKHPASADPVHDERGVRTSGLAYRPADWPKLTTYQCPNLCLCSAARMATAARSPAISSATAHVRTQRPTSAPSRISQRSPPDSSAGALCLWPAAPSPLRLPCRHSWLAALLGNELDGPVRGPRIRSDRPRTGEGGRNNGAVWLPLDTDPALGRPAVCRLAGLCSRVSQRSCAGTPVRLQQRLLGDHGYRAHPGQSPKPTACSGCRSRARSAAVLCSSWLCRTRPRPAARSSMIVMDPSLSRCSIQVRRDRGTSNCPTFPTMYRLASGRVPAPGGVRDRA